MKKFIFMPLILVFLHLGLSNADAQDAYGVSAIQAYPQTRVMEGFSSTYLDFIAGLYYDPEVIGYLYRLDNPESPLDGGGDVGNSSIQPAEVFMFSLDFQEGKIYCTFSQHFIRPFFSEPGPFPGFDPFRFGSLDETAGGVRSGLPFAADNFAPRRIFLGWTQVCMQLPFPPTPTPPPPPPTPTPTPCDDQSGESCQTVRLSVATGPEVVRPSGVTGGNQRASVGVCAYNPFTRQFIPNVSFTLKLFNSPETRDTGGHIDSAHIGPRPLGRLAVTQGRTGSNGCFGTQYSPSHISGLVGIEASTASHSAKTFIGIAVPDFYRLLEGENYRLIGQLPEHPRNHNGTSRTVDAMFMIAHHYKQYFYGNNPIPEADKLRYNDMSLEWGGKFDLDKRWSTRGSHGEHREGINADVRCCRSPGNVPPSRRPVLERIFFENGSTRTLDETGSPMPHWHLRFIQYLGGSSELPVGIGDNRRGLSASIELSEASVTVHYFIENAFWSVYDREAGQEEWTNWHNRLNQAKATGSAALLSEAKAFGREIFSLSAYVARNRTDEEFVSDVYSAYVMREPNAGEIAYWTNFLQNLPPSLPKNRKRSRLLEAFETNTEFEEMILSIVDEVDAPLPEPTP